MKIYSNYNRIPNGNASEILTPGCLVLEGGAFRAVYGEGVVDALMMADINFESTIGISAGALNGISYVSGQIGRSARINLKYRHDPRYVGPKAWIRNQSTIGFDYLFGKLNERDPLNVSRFFCTNRRFFVGAANCRTANLDIFEKNSAKDIFEVIKASCAIPFVSKIVHINGEPYLDGGIHTKVPYQWAIDQGYEKIVVVRTRPSDYRKPTSFVEPRIAKLWYHKYPKLIEMLTYVNDIYNRQCEEMIRLHNAGRIFVIGPSEPVTASRLEPDMEKLGNLYNLGIQDTQNCILQLKAYLNRG